jgi:hypothetical protein
MPVLDLRAEFSRFRDANPRRINLAAHSHQDWPNVTFEAQMRCWEDAARLAGDKWRVVFGELLPSVQEGIAAILNLPDPATIAIAPNTHEFLRRILSCFPADRPARILSTDAEFHTFRRQVARHFSEQNQSLQRIVNQQCCQLPPVQPLAIDKLSQAECQKFAHLPNLAVVVAQGIDGTNRTVEDDAPSLTSSPSAARQIVNQIPMLARPWSCKRSIFGVK